MNLQPGTHTDDIGNLTFYGSRMSNFFKIFAAVVSICTLSGCYLPIGETDPATGLVGANYKPYFERGDRIDHTGTFTCRLGPNSRTMTITEQASGAEFDKSFSYTFEIDDPRTAAFELQMDITQRDLPNAVKNALSDTMEIDSRVRVAKFRKQIGGPTIAEFQSVVGKASYIYFDFRPDGTFSLLQGDYETKKAMIDRLATPSMDIRSFAFLITVSGPNGDVREFLETHTWEHLKPIITCAAKT